MLQENLATQCAVTLESHEKYNILSNKFLYQYWYPPTTPLASQQFAQLQGVVPNKCVVFIWCLCNGLFTSHCRYYSILVDSARGVTCDQLDTILKVANFGVTWDWPKFQPKNSAKSSNELK
jgi:hypothetical protein